MDKSLFIIYKPLEQLSTGLSSNKGVTFPIVEKGNIEIITNIKGIKRKVKFKNTLQTLEIRSNLISLSKLEDKGAHFESGRGKLLIKLSERENIIARVYFGRLYTVNVYGPNTTAFVIYSKHKAVSFDVWY